MTGSINSEFICIAKKGKIQLLEQVLDRGVNINCVDKEGRTALLAATEGNLPTVVRWLLEQGVKIDYFDPSSKLIDQTAFLYAGANGLNEILEILIPFNPDVGIVNGYGGTALIPACEKGHLDTVILLLEKTKTDVNHVNRLGWTALLESIILSDGGPVHQKIIKILLSHGADISIADEDGVTPLDHAKIKGYDEIIDLLTKN